MIGSRGIYGNTKGDCFLRQPRSGSQQPVIMINAYSVALSISPLSQQIIFISPASISISRTKLFTRVRNTGGGGGNGDRAGTNIFAAGFGIVLVTVSAVFLAIGFVAVFATGFDSFSYGFCICFGDRFFRCSFYCIFCGWSRRSGWRFFRIRDAVCFLTGTTCFFATVVVFFEVFRQSGEVTLTHLPTVISSSTKSFPHPPGASFIIVNTSDEEAEGMVNVNRYCVHCGF